MGTAILLTMETTRCISPVIPFSSCNGAGRTSSKMNPFLSMISRIPSKENKTVCHGGQNI